MASLALREIRSRWASYVMVLLAAGTGAAVVVASLASLTSYDRRTERILAEHARETQAGLQKYDRVLQEAMRKLGFNIIILPADQQLADFYADDYAGKTMPQDAAQRLIEAKIMSVGHLVPVLRHKVIWPEKAWTIQVVGFGRLGRGAPTADEAPDVPVLPDGTVDVGWELHHGLGLQTGDRIAVDGRAFLIRRTLAESGSHQDISILMNLRDAQALLGLDGRINEIRALQCRTAWDALEQVKQDVQAVLPGVQVIQKDTETVAIAAARTAFMDGRSRLLVGLQASRAAQRRARVRLSYAISFLALVFALATTGILSWLNAAERQVEVALWDALGTRPADIRKLFAFRALTAGVIGGLAGWVAGIPWWGWPGIGHAVFWAFAAIAIGLVAVVPAGMAVIAVTLRTHPATVLKNEI